MVDRANSFSIYPDHGFRKINIGTNNGGKESKTSKSLNAAIGIALQGGLLTFLG
jgi:hypothetical protein